MTTKETRPAYGGQAVVEGVMFQGKHTSVTAIRRNDGSMTFFEAKKPARPLVAKLKKIPFLRGIVGIIDASGIGTRHLSFSTDHYDVDPKDDDKVVPEENQSKLMMLLGVAAVGVLSFIFGKFVFTLAPAIAAESLRFIFPGHIAQNLIEGFLKLILLLAYIYFVSLTPLVRRVFQYHGAEHKVINAYERGLPLTVENVQKQSRLHYRCGSSFILFTVIVGVLIYIWIPFDNIWERMLHRIALIPVVLGVSYEVLQLTNKCRTVPLLKWLGYPGLSLQRLTTKEPSDDQVEVAIASFNDMLEREKEYEKQLAKDHTNNQSFHVSPSN